MGKFPEPVDKQIPATYGFVEAVPKYAVRGADSLEIRLLNDNGRDVGAAPRGRPDEGQPQGVAPT